MRIWSVTKGTEKTAYKMDGRVFKCFPPSNNIVDDAVEFSDIRAAAIFLLQNEGWGIRMNPGSAIIYRNINISLD